MVIYLVLALQGAWQNSATADELVHLASGWTALHWQDYRLNPEHPPLAKLIAALPLSSWMPEEERSAPEDAAKAWSRVESLWESAASSGAAQWYLAHEMSFPIRDSWLSTLGLESAAQVPPHIISPPSAWAWTLRPQLFRARAAMLVFPALLALTLLIVGRGMLSSGAAALAVVLLAFDPSFIAHGALVTTDVAAAAAIFASVSALWWWMREGSWRSGFVLAVTTGLAAVVKFTSVVLAPLFLLLVLGVMLRERTRRSLARAIGALALAASGAWLLIWITYGFQWSATRGGDRLPLDTLIARRAAVSAVLASGGEATPATIDAQMSAGAPEDGADSLLRAVHASHLLPEAYTYGLAHVRAFAAPRTAMLDGHYSAVGFRSYFLWTFLYKSPLIILLGVLLTIYAAIRRWLDFQQIWWLLVPAVVLFVSASSSGVNIGHRHLLTIYPFLWLLIAHATNEWAERHARADLLRATFVAVAILPGLVAVSIHGLYWMPGNHIAYMNALAGGPVAGAERLTDSNVDWGQDAYRLADWWNAQEPRPLMAYAVTGATDPRAIQLPVLNTQFGYPFAPMIAMSDIPPGALLAVSRTSKSGVLDDEQTRARFRDFLSHYQLIDRVGYGIEIYAPLQR